MSVNTTPGVMLDVTRSQVSSTDVTRSLSLDFMDLLIRCDAGCDALSSFLY